MLCTGAVVYAVLLVETEKLLVGKEDKCFQDTQESNLLQTVSTLLSLLICSNSCQPQILVIPLGLELFKLFETTADDKLANISVEIHVVKAFKRPDTRE